MTTNYFTLGQGHTHSFGGHTLDKDTIIKITDEDPRAKMFELFGDKWAMQYKTLSDLHCEYYKELFNATDGKFEELF